MFTDRTHAGTLLAEKLLPYKGNIDLILGLARGGVVISAAISRSLGIPHDVLIIKKIGSPGNPELAIGAVAPDAVFYIDDALARSTGADETYIKETINRLTSIIKEKIHVYRKGKKPLNIQHTSVILTDDGAATGATIYAAVHWAKKQQAKKIVVALPVAPQETIDRLKSLADEVIVLSTPTDFGAVGEFYREFPQITDEEVVELLT